ncbi:murein DD-endopeptidase MepM/ murein hydrolase activator NlpD [Nocardia kruczakiae]|uniref:Murein DD-endopeptidase MepM/ murein hydrolase activator NlpD n=1 Tax=Nocardia kruczakiae TaxID=261477 RepID=A0ABU1XHH5_9NOCA|nr:M23 family metallopeptidase [Nocardia kruczakiae]MDR7169804.1 murein DD-endopeptidase MepM/ murein hydrolase activator NlpD [Nocardia kruczakiae]
MPGRADSWMSAGAGVAGATVVGLTATTGNSTENAWGATASEDSGQWQPWGAQAQPDGDWTADPQWPRTDEWAAADPGLDDGRGVHYPEGPADYDAAHYDADDEFDEPAGNESFNLARLRSSWKRDSADADETGTDAEGPRRFSGAHRVPTPPAALKGRAAVVAVAAGAVVAAGQAGMESGSQHHTATADYDAAGQVHEIAAQAVSTQAGNPQSPQVLNVAPVADLRQFQDILQHGQEFAAGLAAQESAKLRPLFSKFANGTFTSGFGSRWGVQHLGVDIAAPIGTPIYAVEDGEVISAGPASGFGMWVRLRHADGTITVYGHVDTATVSEGQHVLAGDQIATVGNRGFSTGPHCHFEVWLNGQDKIDPLPWLASRGISLGPERD